MRKGDIQYSPHGWSSCRPAFGHATLHEQSRVAKAQRLRKQLTEAIGGDRADATAAAAAREILDKAISNGAIDFRSLSADCAERIERMAARGWTVLADFMWLKFKNVPRTIVLGEVIANDDVKHGLRALFETFPAITRIDDACGSHVEPRLATWLGIGSDRAAAGDPVCIASNEDSDSGDSGELLQLSIHVQGAPVEESPARTPLEAISHACQTLSEALAGQGGCEESRALSLARVPRAIETLIAHPEAMGEREADSLLAGFLLQSLACGRADLTECFARTIAALPASCLALPRKLHILRGMARNPLHPALWRCAPLPPIRNAEAALIAADSRSDATDRPMAFDLFRLRRAAGDPPRPDDRACAEALAAYAKAVLDAPGLDEEDKLGIVGYLWVPSEGPARSLAAHAMDQGYVTAAGALLLAVASASIPVRLMAEIIARLGIDLRELAAQATAISDHDLSHMLTHLVPAILLAHPAVAQQSGTAAAGLQASRAEYDRLHGATIVYAAAQEVEGLAPSEPPTGADAGALYYRFAVVPQGHSHSGNNADAPALRAACRMLQRALWNTQDGDRDGAVEGLDRLIALLPAPHALQVLSGFAFAAILQDREDLIDALVQRVATQVPHPELRLSILLGNEKPLQPDQWNEIAPLPIASADPSAPADAWPVLHRIFSVPMKPGTLDEASLRMYRGMQKFVRAVLDLPSAQMTQDSKRRFLAAGVGNSSQPGARSLCDLGTQQGHHAGVVMVMQAVMASGLPLDVRAAAIVDQKISWRALRSGLAKGDPQQTHALGDWLRHTLAPIKEVASGKPLVLESPMLPTLSEDCIRAQLRIESFSWAPGQPCMAVCVASQPIPGLAAAEMASHAGAGAPGAPMQWRYALPMPPSW